ncbi:hypothetical protein AMATHDRAFT_54893 [Amanita thiersii Skay4041]|uniref:PPIase cyclophilin-type domain-containing protein n=1 Tax=Amanita thiersii Skay4041 TaxID=703135 RepID=A0A2A9NXR9_9AGAR|nr:hypothetical protein AMATHDRAFT_54893 [Amanita thiersii Skay4041]
MALPTKGRVVISTTVGDIDIELWSKETPKTCRNFLALAMEGYYDGVIFHRVVPGFLVQTGDRTGTGGGGESFYGEPFEDEIHPRLRFTHRGLIGMANNGTKNSNDSQFFITLDRADGLHGKHTLFGRCVGDTIYNVVKIGEMELDDNERPLYPPKIKSIRIVDNPFDDIIPRITAEEKRAQQKAKEQAQKEREEAERRRGAKKNVKLLSFGEDEGDSGTGPAVKKKAIFRPDLLNEPQQSPVTIIPDFITEPSISTRHEGLKSGTKDKHKDKEDITRIREKHAQEQAAEEQSRKAQLAKMEADIRKLAGRGDGREIDEDDSDRKRKKNKKSYLQEELAKYAKGKGLHKRGKDGKKRIDEGEVLAALSSFRGKLQTQSVSEIGQGGDGGEDVDMEKGKGGEGGVEVDDDIGFMNHALHFQKDDGEETQKAERDYEVIDPRQRGARAREEVRERKRAQRMKERRR